MKIEQELEKSEKQQRATLLNQSNHQNQSIAVGGLISFVNDFYYQEVLTLLSLSRMRIYI